MITQDEYKTRRKKLASNLASNSIAIIPSAQIQFRNRDTEYLFRQNSDFYYLTGYIEPNAILVINKQNNTKIEYILFNQPKNPELEKWTGIRVGQSDACKKFNMDYAYPIENFSNTTKQLFKNKTSLYYPFDQKNNLNLDNLNLDNKINQLQNILPFIHEMRVFKSKSEIKLMRTAAEISCHAHTKLMHSCSSNNTYEYQLEAEFFNYCRSAGCNGLAYPSIIASGNNANILHYTSNLDKCKSGDLILADCGGEYQYYAADITRTYPVNGKFSAPQKQLYELVLKAQLAGISQVQPGNTWGQVQEKILEILIEGLLELNILTGPINKLIKNKTYKNFYMHSSGHFLGLDVHDVGKTKYNSSDRVFEPGMVLTVEPGLYIDKNNNQSNNINNKWLGTGIRIEDDILVTKSGNKVLTSLAPKTVDEIEALMLASSNAKL